MDTLDRPVVDEARLQALVGKAMGDLGATLSTAMISIGDRLGLFSALATGAATPAELAARTGTLERYVREWLAAVAAGGYAEYDAESGRFSLSPEQQIALADETSPYSVLGGFESILAATRAEPMIAERFTTGEGYAWENHDARLFEGGERFFGAIYDARLVAAWIPALDGVDPKLRAGALVADVGCGHGTSTIAMARAFPASTFVGYDNHAPSIARASDLAEQAGLSDRVRFETATAADFPGDGYDLVAHFDCLHDMGDPLGAARRVRRALKPEGTWMIVEPQARDRLEENLNPVGRLFYGMSTLICTPHALSEGGESALGAQAGEARIRAIIEAAGFRHIRVAAQTPFNLVFEARP
ncbi:class I SAM-dependent methyltransferase [Agromyces neolithicus]|uniref:Class I SAM-dependent methyltransferase n=1 Tax=Agromyces neolithicus TaxID=269420 RepID=A0ABP4YES2_9MICO